MSENMSYAESYNDITIHELMLKDTHRTLAYMNFFEKNKSYFKDKVVMDVGSGTGILSMFAARVGAKKVYAVEASKMSQLSQKIIQKNKLEDVIQVLEGRVEEVVVEGRVDVIVSEWMGFYLFHESMLASVLIARDRFLKPEGIILPSTATLYAAPVSLQSVRHTCDKFWGNVYGFDFSTVVDEMFTTRMKQQPQTFAISPSDILSPPRKVVVVDLKYADVDDFDHINSNLNFNIARHDVLRAISLWFDVEFSLCVDDEEDENEMERMSGDTKITTEPASENNLNNKKTKLNPDLLSNSSLPFTTSPNSHTTTFSTSPSSPPTHWKQTTILLPSPLLVAPGGSFDCTLMMRRGDDDDDTEGRRYNITLLIPDDDEEEDDDVCDDDGNFEKISTDMVLERIER